MRLRILPVMLGVLLLMGAGCATTQPSTDNTTNPEVKGDTTSTENNTDTTGGIVLTGTNTGPNSVKLEWEPTEEVLAAAKKWMIVESSEVDPAYPEDYRYYFVRDISYRDRAWNNLPQGTSHFRVCAFVDGKCTVYSNDIALEIPGRVPGTK